MEDLVKNSGLSETGWDVVLRNRDFKTTDDTLVPVFQIENIPDNTNIQTEYSVVVVDEDTSSSIIAFYRFGNIFYKIGSANLSGGGKDRYTDGNTGGWSDYPIAIREGAASGEISVFTTVNRANDSIDLAVSGLSGRNLKFKCTLMYNLITG